MRNRVFALRSKILCQAGAVALLAGLSAACSADADRLHEPFFTGSTPNQREIIGGTGDQPMPAPVAPGAVARADLPPPPGAGAPGAGPYPVAPAPLPAPPTADGSAGPGSRVVTVG